MASENAVAAAKEICDVGVSRDELWQRFDYWFKREYMTTWTTRHSAADWAAFQAGAGVFQEHTKAVAQFLNDLYATMIDPCAEGTIKVADMQAALLKAAREHRDQLHANEIGHYPGYREVVEALKKLRRTSQHLLKHGEYSKGAYGAVRKAITKADAALKAAGERP